jgi:hypothetical protein
MLELYTMSYNLPNIIFTIKLEPFINVFNKNYDEFHTVEINDLPTDIQNIIKEHIGNDYQSIITGTLYPHRKVASYEYNDLDNIITMKIVMGPLEIKSWWYAEPTNITLPGDPKELVDITSRGVISAITDLYGMLAGDTWQGGDLNFHIDEKDQEYDIDLRLISIRYKMKWDKNSINGGDLYYWKYMKYKSKYLLLKDILENIESNYKS